MAEGRDEATAYGGPKPYLWTEIFRCFGVALDPRKLLIAAIGILVMSLGWHLLSRIFNYAAPVRTTSEYATDTIAKDYKDKKKAAGVDYTNEDFQIEADKRFERDYANWKLLNGLAGPDGRLRTMPWYEYRGPNPYLFVTELLGGSSVERQASVSDFVSSTVPVLVEPLAKLLIPVIKFLDSDASSTTRLYLFLVVLWSLATWAFFGGIITRIAVVQLSGKDRISFMQAVKFVTNRYLAYFLSPIIPFGIVTIIVGGLAVVAMIGLIPWIGEFLIYGIGFPLQLIGGVIMAILLIGLIGYPMMYTTLSAEGSDTFDALSRSYNYVFQAPWHYLWYSFVAVIYGAAVTFFVVFVASLMVYLGKWAITQAPLSETTNQKQHYLFAYAPESFGWQELFLRGTEIAKVRKPIMLEDGRTVMHYTDANPVEAGRYMNSYSVSNKVGAAMVTFWLCLAFMLMLGFSYSFFWTAVTMIYLLMRKKVDEIEIDEVYLEDEEPQAPLAPQTPPKPTAPSTATSLPMVTAPAPAAIPAPTNFKGPVGSVAPAPVVTPPVVTPPVPTPPAPPLPTDDAV